MLQHLCCRVQMLLLVLQGFVAQQQQQQKGQQQRQQQQVSSSSDSDIGADDSSEDSDIASHHNEHIASASLENEQVLPHSFAAQASVTRRPTLVQQAAAAAIQRSFRQYLSKTGRQDIVQQCSKVAAQLTAAKGLQSSVLSQHHQQRQKAACHIQACWRRFVARRSLAAPLTPPGSCSKAHDSPMQASRPESAASSSLSGMASIHSELPYLSMKSCTSVSRHLCVVLLQGTLT